MSDKCGSCDCADKSQCVKKGNSLVVMTESYTEVAQVSMVAEHEPRCGCTDCKCGTAGNGSCGCG